MANALRALIQFYRTGEDGRPRQVRHRLGGRQVLPGRHHQRVYRGLHGPAWDQGLMGIGRLLRQPEKTARIKALAAQAQWFEDHMPFDPRPQSRRHRHRRQRHRRGHRNGRLGADHADRDQPAERRADPRALRQQVGVAGERDRGVQRMRRRTAMRSEFSWDAAEADRS